MKKIFVRLLIIFAFGVAGCSAPSATSMVSSDYQPKKYGVFAIYDSIGASFLELELQMFFEELGYRTIGENELVKYRGRALGVRCSTEYLVASDLYTITILLEDAETDKTVCTVRGEAKGTRNTARSAAWDKASEELRRLIGE